MRILVLGLVCLGLAACAAPSRPDHMAVAFGEGEVPFDGSPLRGEVEIEEVGGGQETNPLWTSEVGNAEFREALLMSLQNAGLAAVGDGRFELTAILIDLGQPLFGASLTVTSTVDYEIEDQLTGETVFEEVITTPYTAAFGDSLLAVERLRLANEGSIRANIEEFLVRLGAATVPQAEPPVASVLDEPTVVGSLRQDAVTVY